MLKLLNSDSYLGTPLASSSELQLSATLVVPVPCPALRLSIRWGCAAVEIQCMLGLWPPGSWAMQGPNNPCIKMGGG